MLRRCGRGGSAERAGLLFTAQHLALAPFVEADDQFQVRAPRRDSARLFSALLRLVDERIVDFDPPFVALRRLEVVLRRASARSVPEALECDHA
jgi:hypothetical protein